MHLKTLSRRRLFRRPDHDAIDSTRRQIDTQRLYLERLDKERSRADGEVDRSRSRLGDAERDVGRIPDVEAATRQRRDWFLSHPDELAWEADLAHRLSDTSHSAELPTPDRKHSATDLNALLDSIDLRMIDLSPGRPRTCTERHLDDALGITRRDDPVDRLLRPPPGRGVDGPDLGPGL